MNDENMNDIDPRYADGAIKVYESNTSDEFPVLKAFQQYIDAEQAKARKRMMMLCLFFSFLMTVVIAVFVTLLVYVNSRNQTLNDRLVEYAMKDRGHQTVVQPTQDASVLQSLNSKIEELKASLSAERMQTAPFGTSAKKAERPTTSTAEALEIERLKALLAVEKEKAAVEREKQRQAELEEYRRKHYPDLYGMKTESANKATARERLRKQQQEEEEADREIEMILKDIKPIEYFDDEEDEDVPLQKKRNSSRKQTTPSVEKEIPSETEASALPSREKENGGIKDAAGNTWGIPLE